MFETCVAMKFVDDDDDDDVVHSLLNVDRTSRALTRNLLTYLLLLAFTDSGVGKAHYAH